MKDIIVFGTGNYFGWKKEMILNEYNIIYMLDNNVQSGKREKYKDTDIEIMNPNDFNHDGDIPIFLMSVHFISMWKQLCELGVDSSRIVYPYKEPPLFESDNVLIDFCDTMEFFNDRIVCSVDDCNSYSIGNQEEWKSFLRKAYCAKYPLISSIASMDKVPISNHFGVERGKPIDRYYIDQFLLDNEKYICGDVLEIEDSYYTKAFGGSKVDKSIVMDVSAHGEDISFNANLDTGYGIQDNLADCFICTQTLMYISNLDNAARNIGRLLKPGGVALITCSGISQNSQRCMDNYGCFFNFNIKALEKMFGTEKKLKVLNTGSYGNVKTVTAHINGLCCEDLKCTDFDYNDKYYPLIVYMVVRKDG